jgi:hypothetical protein
MCHATTDSVPIENQSQLDQRFNSNVIAIVVPYIADGVLIWNRHLYYTNAYKGLRKAYVYFELGDKWSEIWKTSLLFSLHYTPPTKAHLLAYFT